MSSLYKRSILLFLSAILARIVFHVITGFTADDAFITFRYALNIAYGDGFVYNLNEHVMGTSTPAYSLLLGLFEVLRLPPPNASLFLSLIASGLTAVVLYRFAHSLRYTRLAFLPALLYIFWPRSLAADTCGMETALYGLLVISAFYYQNKRKPFYSLALATLATLTRPEGVILLIILAAQNLWTERHRRFQLLAVPVLLLIPWVFFSFIYFGGVVPNSITAKLALYSRFGGASLIENLVYILALNNPLGWVLLAGLALGAYWRHKKQNSGYLELIWLGGTILFFTFARTRLFFWYVAPIYPVFLLLFSGSLPWLLDRAKLSLETMQKLILSFAIIISLILIVGCLPQVNYYADFQDYLTQVNKRVGDYLYAHADRDNDWAAVEDIGYIGYYSHLKIIDRDGLITPAAVPYNRADQYLQLITDFKPRWVGIAPGSPISGFESDSIFLVQYTLEKSFEFNGKPEYTLYIRTPE